jgi:hypothetical protein
VVLVCRGLVGMGNLGTHHQEEGHWGTLEWEHWAFGEKEEAVKDEGEKEAAVNVPQERAKLPRAGVGRRHKLGAQGRTLVPPLRHREGDA